MKYQTCLLISICLLICACDKGKKPYEEAEALFNKSDYTAAKSKAAEVIENAPNSQFYAQAKTLYEKVEKIEALFKTAEEAGQTGDYKKAIMDYEGILSLDSQSPRAMEGLERIKGTYKSKLMQEGKAFIESGEYKKGIESYREILTFATNDKEAVDALKEAEATFSNLKQTGDEAMRYFRLWSQVRSTARSTRDWENEIASRLKYLEAAKTLCCNISGGRAYLAARLREYQAEMETAKRVLAADVNNRSLNAFMVNYGAWLGGDGSVDQWIPERCSD